MGVPLFETTNQFWVLLATVYGGIVLGLLFDLFSAVRAMLRAGGLITALLDAAYWVIALVFSFLLLDWAADGEFRFFDILGFTVGAGLYFLGPGRLLRAGWSAIRRFFRNIWGRIKETKIIKFVTK